MKSRGWIYIAFSVLLSLTSLAKAQQPNVAKVPPEVWKKVQENGVVRVIVTLTVVEIPEGYLTREAKDAQRQAIADGQNALIAELKGTKHRVLRKASQVTLSSWKWLRTHYQCSNVLL